MSSKYRRGSRDTDGVSLNGSDQAVALQRRSHHKIDPCCKKVFEKDLQSHVVIEGRRTNELDEEVEIALRPSFVPGSGAEERQRPDAELPQIFLALAQDSDHIGSPRGSS